MPAIAIIGYGQIGRATAALLEKNGHMAEAIGSDRSHNLTKRYDYAFVCVPTHKEELFLSTSSLELVVNELLRTRCRLIVVRSTVPIGWTRKYSSAPLVYLPSFARGKVAVSDELNSSRIVAGSVNKRWAEKVLAILPKKPDSFIVSPEVAEIAKLANNMFLVLSIAFANLMQRTAKSFDCNWDDIANILHADPRIGKLAYLRTGQWQGTNLQKDIYSLFRHSGKCQLVEAIIQSATAPNVR